MGPDGVHSPADTTYGPTLPDLEQCFDVSWRFTGPGGSCPLDTGIHLDVPSWNSVANPGAVPPLGGQPRTTWNAELEPTDPALDWYRVATGPAGGVDCRDEAAYGEPVALAEAPVFDAPLPTGEGHYLACILAGPDARPGPGWQPIDHPTVLNTWIDLTPPTREIELNVNEGPVAWVVEPNFDPPALSLFTWKWGPPGNVDCTDGDGYQPHRRVPVELPYGDAPVRLCVIGYDAADNPSVPLEVVFEAKSPGPA
jgi:hypothetical protein